MAVVGSRSWRKRGEVWGSEPRAMSAMYLSYSEANRERYNDIECTELYGQIRDINKQYEGQV